MRSFTSSILTSLLLLAGSSVQAQTALVDMRADEGVMRYLDELNNLGLLDNPTYIVQPLSRQAVAGALYSVNEEDLNQRQSKELLFYRLAFSKDLAAYEERPEGKLKPVNPFLGLERYKQPDMLYWSSEEVTVTLNPIVGMTFMRNQNGSNWQRRIGGDFQANIGRLGIYGSVRDVYEMQPLAHDSLAAPREGALYKRNADGSAEFSETRGGVVYGWKHGHIGLVRDHVRWGYGYYGSNILDIHTAPFAQLKLHLNPAPWFRFDYLHGSLQSDVVDSSTVAQVGGVTTFDYHNKYIVANMLSFRPWKPLWLSFGNSMVYSKRSPEPTFFIPVMFFKSADHYLNGRKNNAGGNAQMFAAFSLRPFNKMHLYSTLYVDEISLRRARDPEAHSNWFSIKSGFRLSNLLPNTSLTFEHIRSNPMVYKHYIETTNYENAGYNMGHYLGDNARELIAAVDFKPWWWLHLHARYAFAQKGSDTKDDRTPRDPVTGQPLILGLDYLDRNLWMQSQYTFMATFQPIYRLRLSLRADRINRQVANPSYEARYFRGSNSTVTVGLHYGF